MAISDRYGRLLNRRAASVDREFSNYSEAFEKQTGQSTKYMLGAMAPLDSKATARLVLQGDRVEAQLKERLRPTYPGIEFRRQGSVSNGTHIKYYSDVDVLTIIDKFVSLEPPQQASSPYAGNPNDDLLTLRTDCVTHLVAAFPAATVDNTGSTSIAISGGSLACQVDVVPANWYDTVAYSQNQGDHTRGIMVYNREDKVRKKNYPFLFNARIAAHDLAYVGVPRALIRLLKSLKADYEQDQAGKTINFSSFDICSIIYRMPTEGLSVLRTDPLEITRQMLLWMDVLIGQQVLRDSLKVIDDSRLIFNEADKLAGLQTLRGELGALRADVMKEHNQMQFLTEAHLGI